MGKFFAYRHRPCDIEEPQISVIAHSRDVGENQRARSSQPQVRWAFRRTRTTKEGRSEGGVNCNYEKHGKSRTTASIENGTILTKAPIFLALDSPIPLSSSSRLSNRLSCNVVRSQTVSPIKKHLLIHLANFASTTRLYFRLFSFEHVNDASKFLWFSFVSSGVPIVQWEAFLFSLSLLIMVIADVQLRRCV